MAKKAFYFSHDSNSHSDPKCLKLQAKLGLEGYGIFWYLVELLREAEEYRLPNDYESLAFAMRTECEHIKSVVEDFNLFTVENGFFWSKSLLNRMEKMESKSQKARESAKKRWAKNAKNEDLDANGMRTHSERNANAMQIKENKIKENKRKENKDLSESHNKIQEQSEKIYSLYPGKCPIKGSSTGKSRKANLKKIEAILKKDKIPFESLSFLIESYIDDCRRSRTWLKNFSTFLNNLPDPDTFQPQKGVIEQFMENSDLNTINEQGELIDIPEF